MSGVKCNRGGGRKNALDELKISTLKNLCVDWATKVMTDEKIGFKEKQEIALKVLTLLPREVSGIGGEAIVIKWS